MPDTGLRASTNADASVSDVAALVQNGRVHSDVYTNEKIFQLELANIFRRTWLYIGHESEIPASGDFRVRSMGAQPVIMVRGHDGKVRVLVNRCRHRGTIVCETESGRTDAFRCWYHGWVYDTTGRLVHVPGPEAYGSDFRFEDQGLTSVPKVDTYREFVFACIDPNAVALREHLGLAAAMIDVMVDASPSGKLIVDSGCYRTVYRGNWKLVGMDGYHPNFTHASVMHARKRKDQGEAHEEYRIESWDDGSEAVTRDLGNGHSMLDMREYRLRRSEQYLGEVARMPGGPDYIEAMHRSYGKERGDMLVVLAGDPHVGIFPNLQLINDQIRLINPLGAGKTETIMFAARLEGVSSAMNEARLRSHEFFYGPAGAGSPDDTEMFERVQRGLMGTVNPWINMSRGLHREVVDADGSIVGRISDEVPQRAQLKQWRKLMASGE